MSDNKTIDQEIMQKVRSVEHGIPQELEQSFLKELEGIEPEERRLVRGPVFRYGTWAAAAVLVLVTLFFFFPLILRQGEEFPYTATVAADEVWVQDAYVEGRPAGTVVIGAPAGSDSDSDGEMTIIWIEKIEE